MIYFDTSFIVPYFLPEVASKQVEAFLRQLEGDLTLSQWTKTEFVSAVGIKCRTGQISSTEADLALVRFQDIISTYFAVLVPQEQDFTLAASFLKSWSLGLRAGDALHLAIASNHRAERLYSLDKTMISAAEFLSIPASKGV